MLRVAYLLTGSRVWSIELVRQTLIGIFRDLYRGRIPDDFDHLLLRELVREWREQCSSDRDAPQRPARKPDVACRTEYDTESARTRKALARLDDHQRAVIAVHLYGGLPVDQLADALDISDELVYIQVVRSRDRLIQSAGLERIDDLPPVLNAVAVEAPRLAIWPEIETEVRDRFRREASRQRRISIGAAAGVVAFLALGLFLVAGRGGTGGESPTPTAGIAGAEMVAPSAVFSVLPTATPTLIADVSDRMVFSSRGADSNHTWLFEERLDANPLLGENTREAGVPVVAPDGQQVYLLWYAFEEGRATGYVAAFSGDLASEDWRVAVTTDDDVQDGGYVDFRLSIAVDHERVYVAVQRWRSADLVEINVLSRDDGSRLETISTNLSGFAAHDVRLHAPPGSNRVSLFAITSEAPPETGGLQITFLSYAVPGGEKIHGRILFDQPDSRAFFLYASQLIAGSQTLFDVENTLYYHQLAVHFFDLGQGRLEPRLVIPFQPVADPLPYQQAVSHDGHWLYVLSPASLEVAVLNLFDRSLAGIVPLDPGVLSGEIGVSYPRGRSMQISPDGSRIYAEGTLGGVASGVWVIDAASWTIIDHWLPESRPAEILLSGDGRTLYARTQGPANESTLVSIDTGTGLAQPLDIPDADRFSLESIATLFQRTYASSPSIDGNPQQSLVSSKPLAAAIFDISRPGNNAGSTVTIDVRFVHPISGEPVDVSGGGARFESPASVRAAWTPEGGDIPLILELGRIGYGQYQGFIRLDEPGYWSVRVDIDWPAGTILDRTMIRDRVLRIMPPVAADGSPTDEDSSG